MYLFNKKPLLILAIFLTLAACKNGGGDGSASGSSGGGSSGGGGNSAPTAIAVSITDDDAGDAKPGDNLTANYSYTDADGDTEGTSTFRWLRDGIAINGATASTYRVAAEDSNKSITVEITPQATTGESTGIAVTSSAIAVRSSIFSNFQVADVVIGQTDFISDSPNQGGAVGANTIRDNWGNPGVANGVLYLPDSDNNRLLGFNSIPTVANTPANFVLGQLDFTSSTTGTTAINFDGPQNISFDNGKTFLTSYNNDRVLIWNSIPISGGVPADLVVGAIDLDTPGARSCNSTDLSDVEASWAVDGKLIVTDTGHHRILIWNTIPSTNLTPADIVLGQQNFTSCAANDGGSPTAQTLDQPSGVWSDGTRLVVLDSNNHRVLIWNTFPTSNFTAADVVLGQSDFLNAIANDDDQNGVSDATSSARTFDYPFDGVYSNGTQLFITDSNNNRVLIWNSFPTTNFTAADVVLGQSAFDKNASNDDDQDGFADIPPSARTVYYPAGIVQWENQLIVSDNINNRYIIFYGQ